MAEEEEWGTLEELVLACAVNRHGTNSWDSISMEVRSRSSNLHLFSPQNCRRKFHDLKQRFAGDDDSGEVAAIVDELKRLRVAELRREVEQRDVSIVSLRLKLKKLEDERDSDRKEETDRNHVIARDRSSPENIVGESSSSRDCRSFNESNSTNRKSDEPGSSEAIEPCPIELPRSKGIWSVNACANSEDGSNLQEREAHAPDESSGPRVRFLETVRSHELASVFLQPLPSQEKATLIRRRMDLQTIQSTVEDGGYVGRMHAFFRDLLLLFTNGVVLFPPDSPENRAAGELRLLVLKEMAFHSLHQAQPMSSRPESEKRDSRPMVVFRKRNSTRTMELTERAVASKHGRSESVGSSSDEESDPDSGMDKLLRKINNASHDDDDDEGGKLKRKGRSIRNGVVSGSNVRSKERGVRGRRRVGRPPKRRVVPGSRSPKRGGAC